MGTLAEGALEVACQTCGATVTFTPPMVAGECDFCGSPLVAQPRSADPVLAPEGVLPFRVTQDAANGSIGKWIGSLWFAPNALKRLAAHEGVGGVYIPFWTYDAYTSSRYTGERGEHYCTTSITPSATRRGASSSGRGRCATRAGTPLRGRWSAGSTTSSSPDEVSAARAPHRA